MAGVTLTVQRLSRPSRKRALCAGVGTMLAVLAGAAWAGSAGAASVTAKDAAGVRLSAAPLGVDVAPWDPVYSSAATLSSAQSLLKAADVTQLHYGGGVSADEYDWQTNTDISGCPNSLTSQFTAACAYNPALPFSAFSTNARALGAQSFVTVNYGSGTPALAAAWAARARSTAGQGVTDWEIGNESYGCWENNNELAGPPADYPGYEANVSSTCPMNQPAGVDAGMEIMADSYAYNAGKYMVAMRAADPSAQLGVPWAFNGTVGGAGVEDNTEWNDTVLGDDAQYIGFVDAHYYPFSFGGVPTGTGGKPTVQEVVQSVEQVPSVYATIRAGLIANGLPNAKVIVGETGVSYLATSVPCTPAGALFAAGDVLEWLAAGAQTVDWWPLDSNAQAIDNNQSECLQPEEAMFTSNGTPDSAYSGYLLASQLAKPNAQLSSLTVANLSDEGNATNVLGFQSVLPDGQVAVALINADTSSAQKVTVKTSLTGYLSTASYSAGDQNEVTATNPAPTKIVDGTSTASSIARGVTLPAESILILKTYKPSSITLGAAGGGNTFRAGAKVTLAGALSLNNAPAPAGVTVTIHRHAQGSTADSATLTAKTTAGGKFTAKDLPPAHGNYVYTAAYTSNTYEPASASFLAHITAVKPALRLTVSAKSVKPGRKVTVTATLGDPHTNRTLVIYAQPKGGKKTVIKRATVNSKGQLSVVYTVKANTTFTVTFAGDTWWTPASATGAVKG
jgi:hypothetical protein